VDAKASGSGVIFAPAKKRLDRKQACSVSISCRARTLAIGRKPSLARIGAEIEGVRLSGELPDATIEGIHAALLRHKVLFFRRHNHLTDDQQEIVLWSCTPILGASLRFCL
jgi:hypothetical protein